MRSLSWLCLGAAVLGCSRDPKPSTTSAFDAGAIDCDALAQAYLSALAQAKRCAPRAAACTAQVPDRLGCACTTFVSAQNPKLLQTMRVLERRWTEQMCGHSVGCVPTPCAKPERAHCSAAGRCADDSG